MSRDQQLEKALTKLRAEGKDVGKPSLLGGNMVIPVDGALLTPEQIFQLTDISPTA